MKVKLGIISKTSFLAWIAILFCFYSCGEKKIILVENGSSAYEISFQEGSSQEVIGLGTIFQSYIKEITTVELPIVLDYNGNPESKKIVIGINDSLQQHQISIITEGNDLLISGGSDAATKDAVYYFLEHYLACKWYSPTVEEVPSSGTIYLPQPLNYTYTPPITTRTVHSRLFYDNPAFADKHKVTYEAFPYYVSDARVHTFNKLVPEDLYYDLHPEYYALRNGRRLPTQLCLTNPDVLNIAKDIVGKWFEKYPESSVVSVSQDDNTSYCTCENCKKVDEEEGSQAGTMIRFVNQIAKSYPDKTISTLAYQHTRKPCKTSPADNVLITLCSIECDRSGPIEEKCIDFTEDLKGWSQLTDNIRIWDYTTQFTNFLAPFPNLRTLQPNVSFFKNNEAKWVFEQHSHNPSELFELRSYLLAKLLWNSDSDIDELITEFTNGFYQEGGVYVKKYIDLIHEKIEEDSDFFLFLYGDPSQAFSSFLNPELLKMYSRFFDDAEMAVKSNPEVVQRIKEARLGVDYAVLEACRKNITSDYSLVHTSEIENKKLINPFTLSLLENFKTTCERADITLMNEMRFTVDDYYTSFKKAMEIAVRPNKALGKEVKLGTLPKKYANEDPRVLTDGALGGNSFYANWLGFEGNNMEVIVDLENLQEVSNISMAFLQVTNHIVFFPTVVTYYSSTDSKTYKKLGTIYNSSPLTKTSKVNDIQYFDLKVNPQKVRFIKVKAVNLKIAPLWHHGAGLPSWIFADEVIVD